MRLCKISDLQELQKTTSPFEMFCISKLDFILSDLSEYAQRTNVKENIRTPLKLERNPEPCAVVRLGCHVTNSVQHVYHGAVIAFEI